VQTAKALNKPSTAHSNNQPLGTVIKINPDAGVMAAAFAVHTPVLPPNFPDALRAARPETRLLGDSLAEHTLFRAAPTMAGGSTVITRRTSLNTVRRGISRTNRDNALNFFLTVQTAGLGVGDYQLLHRAGVPTYARRRSSSIRPGSSSDMPVGETDLSSTPANEHQRKSQRPLRECKSLTARLSSWSSA